MKDKSKVGQYGSDAVAEEAQVGYKAGNTNIDKNYEQIRANAEKILKLMKLKKVQIKADVKSILETRSKDKRKIEQTLDSLLDLAEFELEENEFRKLNDYYLKISPKDAKFYNDEYKKVKDEI
jgi:hypothetical protein